MLTLFYAFFKLERRFPTKFYLKLARVDSITCIMTKAVGYVSDEVKVGRHFVLAVFIFYYFGWTIQETINSID